MSNFKVNFGGLQTAAADIGSGAGKLEQRLADMDASLRPLKADWSGEAASSYEAAKAKWTAAITDMKALLAEIGTAVSSSGEDYQSSEQRNTRRW